MAIINTCARLSLLNTYAVFFTENKSGRTLALTYFRSKPISLSNYILNSQVWLKLI